MPLPSVVVKVGGSLYDLPDLGVRLRHFLDKLADADVVLVTGWRRDDRCHSHL